MLHAMARQITRDDHPKLFQHLAIPGINLWPSDLWTSEPWTTWHIDALTVWLSPGVARLELLYERHNQGGAPGAV